MTRMRPALQVAELTTLSGWLDYHRATLAWKCERLTSEQLRRRPLASSDLSLLGLIRHMTDVEGVWFRDFAGESPEHGYRTVAHPDAAFTDVEDADIEVAFAGWQAEVTRSRAIVAAAPSPEATSGHDDYSLRWILTFVIQEYARHNGHADLLRQAIDGETGE
jgi:uncharacterized damage-inducible protein DinB